MHRRQRRRRPRPSRPTQSHPTSPPLRPPTPARPIRPRRIRRPPTVAPPPAAATPAAEPVKAASNVPAADQPVADKLKDLLGSKSARYFDRKAERTAIEKFYTARDFAPLWTQGGALTATGKGVIARLKDAASDGLNPADYPVPDFAAASNPDALAEADLKLTASMMDYARQAQSGRMHYSQVSGDIQYPEHPIDPTRSADQCDPRQGRLGGARQLQPAAEALSRIEGEARRSCAARATDRSSKSKKDRR